MLSFLFNEALLCSCKLRLRQCLNNPKKNLKRSILILINVLFIIRRLVVFKFGFCYNHKNSSHYTYLSDTAKMDIRRPVDLTWPRLIRFVENYSMTFCHLLFSMFCSYKDVKSI